MPKIELMLVCRSKENDVFEIFRKDRGQEVEMVLVYQGKEKGLPEIFRKDQDYQWAKLKDSQTGEEILL
jgi:hypothetical protein